MVDLGTLSEKEEAILQTLKNMENLLEKINII